MQKNGVRIRKIEKKDVIQISSLCMNAFMTSVAPNLSEEGIATFKRTASEESFLKRMLEDNTILVYEDNEEIKGMVELKQGRHLAMLFVDPSQYEKGVGKKLVSTILSHASAAKITVSASLNSVPAYLKYGFICTGEPDERSGLKYQPMELTILNV